MTLAYLALGANLGDRTASFRGARKALAQTAGIRVLASSPLYETDPVGGPSGQPAYLNAVLSVETELSAADLLRLCLQIEARFGRQRQQHWGPRTLDLDLLLWGGLVCNEPELILPHPRLHQRPFVLAPLRDLAPTLRLPLLDRTVEQLFAALPDVSGVRRLCETW